MSWRVVVVPQGAFKGKPTPIHTKGRPTQRARRLRYSIQRFALVGSQQLRSGEHASSTTSPLPSLATCRRAECEAPRGPGCQATADDAGRKLARNALENAHEHMQTSPRWHEAHRARRGKRVCPCDRIVRASFQLQHLLAGVTAWSRPPRG